MTDTAPLTDQQLADIRQRAEAATPGPWWNDDHEIYQGSRDDAVRYAVWVAETCNVDLPDQGKANAEFIARAREDVPALLAEVRRLRAELATAKARVTAALTVTDLDPDTAPTSSDYHSRTGYNDAIFDVRTAINNATEDAR